MDRIIEDLNSEIERLTRARDVLLGKGRSAGRRGKSLSYSGPSWGGRRLSAEGRRKISEAMKRRWAERRKQQAIGKKQKAA